MRTVSFSSDPVRQALQTDFVPAVINTTGTPATGASCKHSPREQGFFEGVKRFFSSEPT